MNVNRVCGFNASYNALNRTNMKNVAFGQNQSDDLNIKPDSAKDKEKKIDNVTSLIAQLAAIVSALTLALTAATSSALPTDDKTKAAINAASSGASVIGICTAGAIDRNRRNHKTLEITQAELERLKKELDELKQSGIEKE